MVQGSHQIRALFDAISARSFLAGYSAVDSYLGIGGASFVRAVTEGGLVDIAALGDTVEYPGDPGVDGMIQTESETILVSSLENPIVSEPIFMLTEHDRKGRPSTTAGAGTSASTTAETSLTTSVSPAAPVKPAAVRSAGVAGASSAVRPAGAARSPDTIAAASPAAVFRDFHGIPLFQDLRTGAFHDPAGLYPRIRELRKRLGRGGGSNGPECASQTNERAGFTAPSDWVDASVRAVSLARYGIDLTATAGMETIGKAPENLPGRAGSADRQGVTTATRTAPIERGAATAETLLPPGAPELLSPLLQREILCVVMTGRFAARGLSYLMNTGFIQAHWPELAVLDDVQHGKEYHPEGNVWQHTLATLRYIKTRDLRISLALLLHDSGKPAASENEGRTFDRHAQIGTTIAGRFLRRLGFREAAVSDVLFLVGEHMLPAAIPSLPVFRAERALESPLFPLLLEVYRCDLSSTYRGPQGYYEACTAYRSYLRNRKNPFRDAEGKKLLKLYVE